MGERWVPAQDLFDSWSQAEEDLAFERAGGHSYGFDLLPPAPRPTAGPADDETENEVDEFALEDAMLDAHTTAALRVMAAEITDTMAVLDDEVTGTLPAMA